VLKIKQPFHHPDLRLRCAIDHVGGVAVAGDAAMNARTHLGYELARAGARHSLGHCMSCCKAVVRCSTGSRFDDGKR
jgi:hypothetical protein